MFVRELDGVDGVLEIGHLSGWNLVVICARSSSAPSGAAPLKPPSNGPTTSAQIGFFRAFGRGPIEASGTSFETASDREVLPRLRARPH